MPENYQAEWRHIVLFKRFLDIGLVNDVHLGAIHFDDITMGAKSIVDNQ